jgi:hypothetical protein
MDEYLVAARRALGRARRRKPATILEALAQIEPPKPRKRSGRPRRYSDEQERAFLDEFLKYKATLENREGRPLKDSFALDSYVRSARQARSQSERKKRGIVAEWKKLISRWRGKFGPRLRRKVSSSKKSQNLK